MPEEAIHQMEYQWYRRLCPPWLQTVRHVNNKDHEGEDAKVEHDHQRVKNDQVLAQLQWWQGHAQKVEAMKEDVKYH